MNVKPMTPSESVAWLLRERKRREIMLPRVMLLAIDIVLAGEPLGLEIARDLFRKVQHCYPALVDEILVTD